MHSLLPGFTSSCFLFKWLVEIKSYNQKSKRFFLF